MVPSERLMALVGLGPGTREGMSMLKPTTNTVVALAFAALAAVIPTIVAAESPIPGLSCTAVLRVVGVASDDVLFVRNSPWVPIDNMQNKLVGIPAGARGIEDLGETTDGWRLVRYRGIVGYARSNFLATDITICALEHQSQARKNS